MDRRKLGKETNFLTGRWVLTVKVDKGWSLFPSLRLDGCAVSFQDKFAWDQQTDSHYSYSLWLSLGFSVCS